MPVNCFRFRKLLCTLHTPIYGSGIVTMLATSKAKFLMYVVLILTPMLTFNLAELLRLRFRNSHCQLIFFSLKTYMLVHRCLDMTLWP